MNKADRLVAAIRERVRVTGRPVMWASLMRDQQALLGTVPRKRDALFRRGELVLFMGSSASGGGGAAGPGGIAGYSGSGDEGGVYDPSVPSASSPVGTGGSTTVGGLCTYTSVGQAKIAYRQYRRLAAQAKADGDMAAFRAYTLQWKCAKNEMERLSATTYGGESYWGAYGDVCSRTQKWYNKRLATLEKWQTNPPRLFAERRIARKARLVEASRQKALSKNCPWVIGPQMEQELQAANVQQQQLDQVMQQEYLAAQQDFAQQGAAMSTVAARPVIKPWVIAATLGGVGLIFLMVMKARQRAAA